MTESTRVQTIVVFWCKVWLIKLQEATISNCKNKVLNVPLESCMGSFVSEAKYVECSHFLTYVPYIMS